MVLKLMTTKLYDGNAYIRLEALLQYESASTAFLQLKEKRIFKIKKKKYWNYKKNQKYSTLVLYFYSFNYS